MTVGERIKERRKELRISVDYVAERLGKNRATIYRYESDEIENLPVTILGPLSEILETTPAYLMGWSDNHTNYNDTGHLHTTDKNNEKNSKFDSTKIDLEINFRNASTKFELDALENQDIRTIVLAGKKMTPEQIEVLRKYAEFMFPEAFK